MQTYNPNLANLTPTEIERLTYVTLHPFDLFGQHTLSALRDAEQADAVRAVLENYDFDFDDTDALGKSLEHMNSRDQLADERKYRLDKLIGAVEEALQILQQPAKRGSEYALAVIAELEFALNQVDTEDI